MFSADRKINMKNNDYETWIEDKKDISNNLAVPLYRQFCKEYGLNFHFSDEEYPVDDEKILSIRHEELPLLGKSLALFNFINKPYHKLNGNIVIFTYTSWDDFDFEKFSLEETTNNLEEKDILISKLEHKSIVYQITAILSTVVFVSLIIVNTTSPKISGLLGLFSAFIVATLVTAIAENVYSLKRKVGWRRFNEKLAELKQGLEDVSNRHGLR